MNKIIILFVYLVFFVINNTYSQLSNTTNRIINTDGVNPIDSLQTYGMAFATSDDQIIPFTPKASSIMRYGEHPVSLHTGLLDITVPIYTIERGNIKVPVEFKYHASGLKYDDVSNEIGLGWTLMAGGVITYSVKGARDNTFSAYAKDAESLVMCNYPSTNNGSYGDYTAIREVENGSRGRLYYDNKIGKKDGEIDMYNFSFLHHSGSFCFPSTEHAMDKHGSYTGVFIPENGMKVVERFIPNQLHLLDTDGIFYKFEVKDKDFYLANNERSQEYYLTEIISADKTDTISFVYKDMSASLSYIKRPVIKSTATYTEEYNIRGGGFPVKNVSYSGGVDIHYMRPPRLERINFRGGFIAFEYAAKNNVESWDLQKVKIYNNTQFLPLQTITLEKTKFVNNEDRLDKVVFTNSQSENYDYQFKYKGSPGSVWGRYPSGIDYWGYFNGATVPYGYSFIPKFDNMPYGMQGTDRTANEFVMQGGILEQIIYPTKGYSKFTYEAHKARYSLGSPIQTLGGLRIKEVRSYLPNGMLAERKWYGYNTGMANAYPDIKHFITNSRVLTTVSDLATAPDLMYVKYIKQYSTFPKVNYFISGSSAVYTQVNEYVGNASEEYGRTVYTYNVALDEKKSPLSSTYRWDTPDTSLRTYPWKTGNLTSKRVYKRENEEYKEIYSLVNEYKDINTAEFRNLRVLPYLEFAYRLAGHNEPDIKNDFCRYTEYHRYFDTSGTSSDYTPYDYFNYYTTTGLRILASSKETTDDVTTYTYYESPNEIGLPTKIRTISSTGENFTTTYKYTSDHAEMKSANILTSVMEKSTYKNDNTFLQKEITNYSFVNSKFYAPANRQIQYKDGTTEIVRAYKYDNRANILQIDYKQGERTAYLWGYNSQYPIAEIKNAGYSDVTSKIQESTLKTISEKNEPSLSDWSVIDRLRSSMNGSLINTYKYTPLVGVTNMVDARGISTNYDYDTFGRLKKAYIEENGIEQKLEEYEYSYLDKEYVPLSFSLSYGEGREYILYGKDHISSYSKDKQGGFKTNVYGGSGDFQYTWTLKDANGNVVKTLTETSGKFNYYFDTPGEMEITCKFIDLHTFEEFTDSLSFTVIDFKLPWPLVVSIESNKKFTIPGETVKFEVYKRGGSGFLTYKWTLKNPDGSILTTTTNYNPIFNYSFHNYGKYELTCDVSDNMTGEKFSLRCGHQVDWLLEFENIKETKNRIEATITIKETATIYFYVDFNRGDTNAIGEFQLGDSKVNYSSSHHSIPMTKTFAPGTYKFGINLAGATRYGYCEAFIYFSTTDKGQMGSNNWLKVKLTE